MLPTLCATLLSMKLPSYPKSWNLGAHYSTPLPLNSLPPWWSPSNWSTDSNYRAINLNCCERLMHRLSNVDSLRRLNSLPRLFSEEAICKRLKRLITVLPVPYPTPLLSTCGSFDLHWQRKEGKKRALCLGRECVCQISERMSAQLCVCVCVILAAD